jgi:exopolyphosphatase/guanosine-5'-triphosphate,3'-diphosphate pyrophosphatase
VFRTIRRAVRVAVVDLGSNSTRLLIADVEGSALTELDRRTTVTRLGDGVDRTGELSSEAIERVEAVLVEYASAIADAGVDATVGVLTSAVRDARNGAELAASVRDQYGIDARVLSGDEEARLTFLGATAGLEPDGRRTLVIDIGGGSTEVVVGRDGAVEDHVSLQLGVVRHSERHLVSDPPRHRELEALADDVRATFDAGLPEALRGGVEAGIGVAGTPTSCAAIAQELDPYDSARIEGYVLDLGVLEMQLALLAGLPLDRRRAIPGLHPDRAPTIVAGVEILVEALRATGLRRITASERDILHGAALERGRLPRGTGTPHPSEGRRQAISEE